MTREEHLIFCKKCINRRADFQAGLLCNLTGEKADFDLECKSFKQDYSISEHVDHVVETDAFDVLEQLTDREIAVFKSEQSLSKAIITGIIVGIIGALLWGTITVITEFQIGYMAVAIGAGVGYSMRFIGKGIDQIFGIAGGIIALLSCLLGNFFSLIGFAANSESLGYFETLTLIDYSLIIPIMIESFSPIDILFYGIAAYEGYKLSFRQFTENEIHKIGN